MMLSMLLDYAKPLVQENLPTVLGVTAVFLLLRLLLRCSGWLVRRSLPYEITLTLLILYLATV
ncbi:MAG: hypothetical protein K2K53_11390, partial [Oscillospiraceae bacterium]|nr:hypothetical protein [Oscillospiraceae bacterium]